MRARSATARWCGVADGVAASVCNRFGTAAGTASCGIAGASFRLIPLMHCSRGVMYVSCAVEGAWFIRQFDGLRDGCHRCCDQANLDLFVSAVETCPDPSSEGGGDDGLLQFCGVYEHGVFVVLPCVFRPMVPVFSPVLGG